MKSNIKCQICNEEFLALRKFNNHLKQHHHISSKNYHIEYVLNGISPKCKCGYCDEMPEYRDNIFHDFAVGHKGPEWRKKNYIKKYGTPTCKTCGKSVNFTRGAPNKYCSLKCVPNGWNQETCKKTLKERYDVENSFQLEKSKEKSKQTKKERYGNEYYSNREKVKKTCKEKWGVDNVFQSKKIKEDIKKIYVEKYGVEYPGQVKNIFEKQQKSAYYSHKYLNIDIYYRGSYELDFLEKFLNMYPDLKNGPSIKYRYNNKNKIYFPDFYIPSLNLIIEIKNSYLIKKDKKIIEAKQKATISKGFNYIMIVDKDYTKFILNS